MEVNGKSSSANLPNKTMSGSLEHLDPSSLPTDFESSDILLIQFKFAITTPGGGSDWNSKPTLNNITPAAGNGITTIMIGNFSSGDILIYLNTRNSAMGGADTTVDMIYVSDFSTVDELNSKTDPICKVNRLSFNGGGCINNTSSITYDEFPDYVGSIMRLR